MTSHDDDVVMYTISLLGDVMLGRLIDQLLPVHVEELEEAEIVTRVRKRQPHLIDYNHQMPWGNTLSLLEASDLVLCNLETSMSTHPIKWPDKVFNYRMHPRNVDCLLQAGIGYVSLANNHTLDFSKEGLFETVRTLKAANIAFAGAGETEAEARRPAVLELPPDKDGYARTIKPATVHVYSLSDHPSDWKPIREFNHLEYTSQERTRLKDILLSSVGEEAGDPSLKIVSVHWGPNYRWQPDQKIQDMAHFLIDSCSVDVIWGHSSHHVQGVEVYQGKLIIYGCGDFVDDYAVNPGYRNDLSAAWNLKLARCQNDQGDCLRVRRLEVWPNRIKHFQAGLLAEHDGDHAWVRTKFTALCAELGTKVESELGSGGQIIVDLESQ